MNMTPAEVTLPSETEVKVTRKFDAPAELVWRTCTEPELIKRWLLGPPGWSMTICEVDLQVGGRYRYRWRNDESRKEFGFYGVYQRIEPYAVLAYTQIFEPGTVGVKMAAEAVITATYEEANEMTTMVSVIRFQSIEDRDVAISTGMTDGMEASYRLLNVVLAELNQR